MHLVFLFGSITKGQYGPDLGPEPLTQGEMNFTIFYRELLYGHHNREFSLFPICMGVERKILKKMAFLFLHIWSHP